MRRSLSFVSKEKFLKSEGVKKWWKHDEKQWWNPLYSYHENEGMYFFEWYFK